MNYSVVRQPAPTPWLKKAILPGGVLSLIAGIWFAPLLFNHQALFWGTPSLQFVPWWHFAAQSVQTGALPLWNPLVGMGAPLAANYQSAIFYPPNWLYFIADRLGGSPWIAWLQAPVLALHLVMSGTGMAILLKRLGVKNFGQLVGALAWAFSGYLTARINFPSIIVTATWIPWIILSLTPVDKQRHYTRRNFIHLVFPVALCLLSGHAQTAWYALLLAGIWSAYFACRGAYDTDTSLQTSLRPQNDWQVKFYPLARLGRAWGWLSGAVTLAAGIAAPQLFLTAEYLLQSQRAAAVGYDLAVSYSFWPWRLATLLAPGLFGSPVQGNYWGYGNYWEDALYIGFLPLLLAGYALIKAPKNLPVPEVEGDSTPHTATLQPRNLIENRTLSSGFRWLLVGLILSAIIWGLGRYTPVFPWLYRNIPTFDLFQAPTRVMIWVEFSLAILAGWGAQFLCKPEKRALYWARLGTAAALAVSIGATFARLMLSGLSPSFFQATALAGGWGILAGFLYLTAPGVPQPAEHSGKTPKGVAVWQVFTILVVSADLLIAAWGLNPAIETDFYTKGQAPDSIAHLPPGQRLYLPPQIEEEIKFDRFLRFDSYFPSEPWQSMRRVLLPNLPLLEGLPSANNFDPMVPARYARWMDYLSTATPEEQARLLALMGVGAVGVADSEAPGGVGYALLAGSSSIRWVPCAVFVKDEQAAWQEVTNPRTNLDQKVILERDPHPFAQDCSHSGWGLSGLALAPDNNPNQKTMQVTSTSAGWLVLSDTWYPGWSAKVDGEKMPLLRANFLFQAIALEPGTHFIQLVYEPVIFKLGVVVSLVSMVSLIWVASHHRLRKSADDSSQATI